MVADTGSTDGSPRIAAELGARVFDVPWRNDFAAARNAALERARGRFVLYIDADERAGRSSRETLISQLADPGVAGATVRFRSRTGFTRYREYRLFRNDPRIRFENVIHETMVPDLETVMRADGLRMAHSDLDVDHFGYDGDQAAKHRRDIPLLRERLARDPGHVYSWNHLGQALAGVGDAAGALAAWRRAVGVVRARGVASALDRLPYGSLLLQPGAAAEAEALLDEALDRFAGDPLFRWLHGRRLAAAGRFTDAIALFEALIAVDPEALCDENGIAYDARLFRVFSYDALALCHFRLGRHEQSARYYALAESSDPGNPAHRVKRELAAARVSRRAG